MQAQTQTVSSVREQRIAAGLTQRELAIAADCSLPSVANLVEAILLGEAAGADECAD